MSRAVASVRAFTLLLAAAAGMAWCGVSIAQSTLPPHVIEQVVMVPKTGQDRTINLETTIFRPAGMGPFPLVVINHGKSPGKPAFQGRARFEAQTAEFLRRGYAVALPMRQGFSKSGGVYVGGGCDFHANGIKQAEDVVAALDYLVQRPYVDPLRIVVVGQSYGGLSTMALSAIGYPGVLGVVNFAGGLRNDKCPGWENGLIDAFGDYGRTARYPSLWIYGDNDSFWPWPLPERMFNNYKSYATGRAADARFIDVGEFETDSHKLFSSRKGLALWLPEVGAFFRQLGLPFDDLPERESSATTGTVEQAS